MLSPLSQNQKDVSEEDSSGSDAGSGVISEPETDRFGFIVTDTSSAGSVGPPPELVRQREAKWINIMTQWECILSKKKNKVKVQCQKGIPASLRAKCWPLLCAATDRMEKNKKLYQSLDLKPALQSWVDVIERDLDRQFPFHEMFLSKDGHGQRGLFRVLKAYTQYQPKDGYCQAQGPVAAVLLMNMPAEEAFWCLVQISEQYLPGYYSPLLEGVLFDAVMLTWVLKRTCPAAHRHLQHYEVEPLMFATDWLMCLFTRHLPFNTLLRVWDLFFCYGVRVLLQVAVVLVRRVLGRAEQRKQCQGQMETLERLRGVREQVQEEDDNFIAEVCSVQLSARDLEKHTEKELEKWRKDRPSSTFDPRRRCMGYQMAWAMALHDQQEREKEEREKGNLSVPLSRSASTLSLSPSVLRKKWKKSGKVNTGERERGAHIVRHLSMGSEDHMRWTEVNFKRDHGVQEEEAVFLEEPTKQMQAKKLDNIQNTPTEQGGEIVKTLSAETKESQFEEPFESKNETQESTPSATKDVTEDHVQPIEQSKQDSDRQLQGLEQESCKNNDQEIEDKDKRTEKQTVDSEPSASVDEIQTEMLKHDDVDTYTELEENVPQAQVDSKTEISTTTTETSLHSETDRQDKTSTQQPQTEAITEIDNSSQGDMLKRTHHSIESLTETQKSYTQTPSEADVLVQTQEEVEESTDAQQAQEAGILPTNLEQHVDSNTEAEVVIPYIPECNHVNEDTDLAGDAEAEIPNDTVSELSETFDLCLEASEATEKTSEADRDQTKAEEMSTHSETNEGTSDFIASPQDKDNLPTVPDGKTSSVETSTTDEPTSEQSKIQANDCAVEEEESPKSVQENAIGNEICNSFEPTDSNTNSDPPGGEVSNNGLPQASSRRSSRSSGDFCIRKSSNTRGSKLVRRLSEDLFTMPQKPCQSQSLQKRSEVKHTEPRSNPVAVNSTQSHPDMSSEVSSSMTDKKEKQKEPPNHSKGFGLFHRLRGEQAKKTPKQTPKIQVPKILIQDFSDGTGVEKPVKEYKEEKLSSKEKKRRQRDRERRAKEEEKMRKQRENEQEKVTDQERRKVQTIGRSSQVEGEKGRGDELQPAKTQSNVLRYSTSYANSYF